MAEKEGFEHGPGLFYLITADVMVCREVPVFRGFSVFRVLGNAVLFSPV